MASWRDPLDRLPIRRRTASELALAAGEVVLATAVATGCIAALQDTAPAVRAGRALPAGRAGVAIRRGQLAALATAVLSMLTLNYLFITPRHQLTIAHSQDVVELAVLLIVAVVVGRLAATGRERAAEAERRAVLAAATRARGDAARRSRIRDPGRDERRRAARDAGCASGARHRVKPGPCRAGAGALPEAGELAMPLRARTRTAWLYVSRDTGWEQGDLERIAEPLGRLIDVAVERERLAERAAETEAARRADVARTAILHAISHDLRSPLTAITTAGSGAAARSVSPTNERAELIDVIETEGARLAKLVDDLLDLSKIEAGAVAPQADWCDLHDVVGLGRRASAQRAPDRVPPRPRPARWSGPTPPSSSACSRT